MNAHRAHGSEQAGAGPQARPQLGVVPLVLGAALVLAGCGGGPGAGTRPPCRGRQVAHYPSFLPKKTLDPDVDAALIGTEAKPALQVEGLPSR